MAVKTKKTKIIKKTGKAKRKPVMKPAQKIAPPKRVSAKPKKPEKKKAPARIATRPGRVAGGPKAERYIEAVGRRKSAVARVRFWVKGNKEFLVNNKNYQDYFPNFDLQKIILSPLDIAGKEDSFKISAKVKGGGRHGQAEAVRHGLSRVLEKLNSNFRKPLKQAGFLTRDPRMRERKKFGLKRARKGPQWSKR